jgi:predicted O-methyltransferase YrrM
LKETEKIVTELKQSLSKEVESNILEKQDLKNKIETYEKNGIQSKSKYDLSHLTQDEAQISMGPIQDDEALLLYALVKVIRPKTVVEFGFGNFLKYFNIFFIINLIFSSHKLLEILL